MMIGRVACAGLDARAAAIVMRAVRNIVNTGRTIGEPANACLPAYASRYHCNHSPGLECSNDFTQEILNIGVGQPKAK